MVSCSFLNCSNQNKPSAEVKLFEFPFRNLKLLQKWVSAVNRKNWIPSKDDYICQNHFPASCFINGSLRDDAIPEGSNSAGSNLPKTDVAKLNSLFSHMCRLCGKRNPQHLADIFDKNLQIFKKISMCLPIIILTYDSLPKQICSDCLNRLNIAFGLLINSIATEKKFKKTLDILQSKREAKCSLAQLPLNGPIDCDICGLHFTDMIIFDKHVIEHESELILPDCRSKIMLTCTKCGYVYKDKEKYEQHKNLIKTECIKCNLILQSACASNTHECQEKCCNFCNIPFQDYNDLTEHMTKVHSIKFDAAGNGIFCENCRTVVKFGESLGEHLCFQNNFKLCNLNPQALGEIDLKKFTDSRLYICKICGHIFEFPKDIIVHHLIHKKGESVDDLRYKCDTCNETFTKREELMIHCLKSHGPPSSGWQCKFCGKCMTTKISLGIHERIHAGVKPFICEWCGNGFRSRANLTQHQAVHTGVRNHPCPRCGKKFSRKSFVRTHLRIHTGERPYSCDICGQRFTQIGDMRRHKNRHQTGNKELSTEKKETVNSSKENNFSTSDCIPC